MERRKFIQNSGLLAAGLYHSPLKAIAGPFAHPPLLHNIPLDKKLEADLNAISLQLFGVPLKKIGL